MGTIHKLDRNQDISKVGRGGGGGRKEGKMELQRQRETGVNGFE